MYHTKVGVDLAKEVIQVCELKGNRVVSNTELSRRDFVDYLANRTQSTIVFEACSMSNYWKQRALAFGHDARLISAKLVEAVRQNQKTDKNDALAIIQAAMLPDVKFVPGKTPEQQQLQSLQRLRELAVKHRDALKKQLVSLFAEIGIHIGKRKGGLLNALDEELEDAENGLLDEFRLALYTAKQHLIVAIDSVDAYEQRIANTVNAHEDCKKLLKLEGVGHVNAVNLYIKLAGNESEEFTTGRQAAANMRVTPIQHSSGGKTKLGSIGRGTRKDNQLRSQLITGAMSVVQQVAKRSPKTTKETWLKGLIERRGKKCAAVALANKTIRTAFAILRDKTEYKATPMAAC